MNFLALGMRSIKNATKYADQLRDNKAIPEGKTWDDMYQDRLQTEHKKIQEGMELGFRYYDMFRKRMEEFSTRKYLITVRPPHDVNFNTFKHAVESYINRYHNNWLEYRYAYEQKGIDEASLGTGFHIHLIIWTTKINYYPSHILRDTALSFPFVAKHCIQVDTIQNLEKAIQYISGMKEKKKMDAVKFDKIWREKMGLSEIYCNAGVKSITPAQIENTLEFNEDQNLIQLETAVS